MFKEVFDNRNQKRRRFSMLRNVSGKIKYVLVLALMLFLVAPVGKVLAGTTSPNFPIANTGKPQSLMYFFWDLRGSRKSFFQLSNTSSSAVKVHVQIFNAGSITPVSCSEFNFEDTYTGNDTHVYNLSALTSNDGKLTGPPPLKGGFGFIAVGNLKSAPPEDVLIGNFRVIDVSGGFEYRTNSAEIDDAEPLGDGFYTFNFNNKGSVILADVVGIVVSGDSEAHNPVAAGPSIAASFHVNLFNDAESKFSCPDVRFSCDISHFDYGINSAITNPFGSASLCTDTNAIGFVRLDPITTSSKSTSFVVGFIGLNNGNGSGSMDAWWGTEAQ
jgi:hypothetical protein